MDLVSALPEDDPDKLELMETQERLLETYDTLANQYHTEKLDSPKNSLVLGWNPSQKSGRWKMKEEKKEGNPRAMIIMITYFGNPEGGGGSEDNSTHSLPSILLY